MDIENLRCYLSVYMNLSFSKAARDCYVTQPVISRKIAALEEEFGCVFFRRTPQGVFPTKGGKCFLDYAIRMLHLYDEANEAISQFSRDRERTLTVAAVTSSVDGILPPMITRFYTENPGVEVLLDRYTPKEMEQILQDEDYDVFITLMSDLERQADLYRLEISRGHACLTTRREDRPQSDAQAAGLLRSNTVFVVPQADSPHLYELVRTQLQLLGVEQAVLREMHPIEMHSYCVSAGMGVAIGPPNHLELPPNLSAYTFQNGPEIQLGVGWRDETPLISGFLKVVHESLKL